MKFLKALSLTIALSIIVAVATASDDTSLPEYVINASGSDIASRVEGILSRTPLIDGHNDLAIFLRYSYNSHIYEANFTTPFTNGGLGQHVDITRLKKGRYHAQALAETNAELETLRRLQEAYPNSFDLSSNSNAAVTAVLSGKIASPLCVEGLHLIGNSTATLRHFYSLGVRYITLTHNCHNIYADAAMVDLAAGGSAAVKPYWHGISLKGRDVVREMNRLGMMVDLSHVSVDTMRDALGGSPEKGWTGSLAPVIFSHSSAYSICPHPRNVPDDILHLVKKRDSLVMVTFATDFLSCKIPTTPNPNSLPEFVPENSTIAQVVRHIKYIGDLIGFDHVGLGSDFDGIFGVPRGLEDVSKFPDLIAEMLEAGISDGDAEKVIGGNILRVWAQVETIAKKLQQDGMEVAEDEMPWLKRPGEK